MTNNANQYLPPVIAIPSALQITNMTQSFPMVITTSNNTDQENTYQAKQLIKLFIPRGYGMFQANGAICEILSVNGDDIAVNIDSTNFDAFITPPPNTEQPASLSPSGSRNLEFNNFSRLVPFQSLNNNGN